MFPGGSLVKNLPAMQETWVASLGRKDPLEKEMATHSRILAWRIPTDRGAWQGDSPCGHKESDTTGATNIFTFTFSSVQLLSHVRLPATPCTAARQASLSITNSRSLLKLMSIESVMPSSHLILCRPLLLLPPVPPASGSFPMSQLLA